MDFLQNIFLDNTIKSYLIVAGSILIALLLKKFLSRYIAAILYRLFRGLWGNVEKKYFVDLVLEPLEFFLLIMVTVFSIDKLNFPADWQYKIYGTTTETILERIGIGIIVISFIWLSLRLIDFIAMVLEHKADLTEDQSDNQLILFFKDFFKVLLVLIGILAVIKFCFNKPIGPMITGLGLAGAAIALASKESLENIIASFVIFFDKPFITGDFLKVQNISGTVERIGLRSTRIRTSDKTLVTVPNKQMVDSVVDNYSMRTQRRAEIKLELSPKTNTADAEKLIAGLRKLLEDKPQDIDTYTVFLKDISKTGMLVLAEYFTQPISIETFDLLKEELNFSIKKIMDEQQISFSGWPVTPEGMQG